MGKKRIDDSPSNSGVASDDDIEQPAGEEPEEEEEYVVEKILKKRVVSGKIEYFLKWKGYPESENTWEPSENLGCPELVDEFEKSLMKGTSKADKGKKRAAEEPKEKTVYKESVKEKPAKKLKPAVATKETRSEGTGFDRGLVPDKIIGATDSGGQLMFLIKWKDTDEADLVPASVANMKCPQVVISFYEERLTWHNNAGDAEVAA